MKAINTKIFASIVLMFLLASCNDVQENTETGTTVVSEEVQEALITDTIPSSTSVSDSSEIELDLKDSETVFITLDSENTQIESDAIQVSGQQVTIKKS